MKKLEYKQELFDAMQIYHSRKERKVNPAGGFDGAGRWQPSAEERQDCCHSIRNPTKKFPFSLLNHCRSIEHVARKCKVEFTELRHWVYIHTKGTKRLTGGNK